MTRGTLKRASSRSRYGDPAPRPGNIKNIDEVELER